MTGVFYVPLRLNGVEWTLNKSQHTQSSQLDEPLWTDLGTMSEINVRELISTSNKKKKSAGGE